jgi:hypothetical protein
VCPLKNVLLCVVIAAFIFTTFGCNTEGKKSQSTVANVEGAELFVEPGPNWHGKMKVFIFSIKKTPQMAAWIEDGQGNYISTIIVTDRSAKNSWRSAPTEGRPEALPVWNHRMQNNAEKIDSVSSATPKGAVDVQLDNGSLINGHEYGVYLEINHSFDYNDFWTEDNSGVNGQPSLIYFTKFIAGSSGRIKLNPIGHGSVDGSNGNIVDGLNKITTALAIVNEAYLIIN